jgi:hypothetical protein
MKLMLHLRPLVSTKFYINKATDVAKSIVVVAEIGCREISERVDA